MKRELGLSLMEALDVITGARQDSYGNPEYSFQIIADFWNIYLREIQKKILTDHGFNSEDYQLVPLLEPIDVSNMMILLKQARCLGQGQKRDNYIDINGYSAIAADRLMKDDRSEE